MRIILATIAFVMLATPSWSEPVEATPKDIHQFGWEYIGERVYTYGIPKDFWACRRSSNKGSVCFSVNYDRKNYRTVALFNKEIKSREIKNFIGYCSQMTGIVEERDALINNIITKIPLIIVDEITYASSGEFNLDTCTPLSNDERNLMKLNRDGAGGFR